MKKDKSFHTVRGYQMLNTENKILTSGMEDYLEMIYRICKKDEYARINQLASKLNVRPSSTSKIIQKLKVLCLVDYEKYGIIKLTNEGREIGAFLLKRHDIIAIFLKNLGIEATLLKDTEMIEHDVGINTLSAIHTLNNFFDKNPEIIEKYKIFKKNFNEDVDSSYLYNDN